MSGGAVSTGTFPGREVRAEKASVRLESEGAQARFWSWMRRPDTHWSEQGMEMTRKEGSYIGTKSGRTQKIHRRPTTGQKRRRECQWSKGANKAGK